MTKPPRLTDRRALQKNRARSEENPALFLQEAAADDVQERLLEVNRTFTAPGIVTGFPNFWQDRMPNATIIDDTDTLALDEASYDLIIHSMALHWADDPVGQLVQCRRALRPDGLLIATSFAGQTLHELRSALAQAESDVSGGLSPRILPMADLRDLGGLLQRAGFALPVADATPITATYRDMFHLMADIRAMGEANAMHARLRHFTPRSVFLVANTLYQDAFPLGSDRINATFEIATLTGWAPAESQPKPLRPGSATHKLADALGTQEHPLKRSKD